MRLTGKLHLAAVVRALVAVAALAVIAAIAASAGVRSAAASGPCPEIVDPTACKIAEQALGVIFALTTHKAEPGLTGADHHPGLDQGPSLAANDAAPQGQDIARLRQTLGISLEDLRLGPPPEPQDPPDSLTGTPPGDADDLVGPGDTSETDEPDEPRDQRFGGLGLDPPIPVHYLNFSEVSLFAVGAREMPAAEIMLEGAQELIFPIVAGGKVLSSVTVRLFDGAWRIISIGRSHLIPALLACHENASAYPSNTVGVYVASLYQFFLVNADEAGNMTAFPVYDDPRGRFEATKAYAADKFYGYLLDDWKLYDRPLSDEDEEGS